MRDLTVILQNKPGTLADLGEALGKANINMEGICGFPCEGEGVLHILVDDATSAKSVLEKAGFEVREEREVLVHDLEDKPGSLGELCRRMANAGVNIDLLYGSYRGAVFGVDDLDKARASL
ncbi:MAG: amino acid-binding protein [Candidatus Heimdallarchaeota archaeon]